MSQDVALPMDIRRIRELLPHRYPFLLVDRVVSSTRPPSASSLQERHRHEGFFRATSETPVM